jgi:2-polyprenyl-3-methyl-5-hydroxy-6-metoxy-1,4-benzoquinol methylase
MPSEEQPRTPDAVVDVSRLMEDVRERVARKRARGVYGESGEEDLLAEGPPSIDSGAGEPLDRLRAEALVVGRRETMLSLRRFIGPGVTLARRGTVKVISPFLTDLVMQINAFHLDVASYLQTVEERLGQLERRAEAVASSLKSVTERLEDVDRRADDIAGLAHRTLGLLHPLALHPQTTTVDTEGRDAIGFREGQEPAGDDLYRQFEDVFRESEEIIRDRQHVYLGLLKDRQPVLDVGCGRGELLDLLADEGIPARGVDSDEGMVAHCRAKGHDVELADVNEFLEAQPDASLGAVFSAQLIEHLGYEDLQRFMGLARDKLVPGGLFIAETVNPHSIIALRSFWVDPTHRAPIYPEVVTLLARLHGYSQAIILFPRGAGELEKDRAECGDYSLVATK